MEQIITMTPQKGSAGWQLLQKGKDEGKVEATHDVAKALFLQGVEDSIIINATGLSQEDLNKIKAEIEKN